LQLLLPVGSLSWSVFEAALSGGAPFPFDEAHAYMATGLSLELLVTASSVSELSENIQDDGMAVRQVLPAVTP